jgi:two-component system chemotaxis sensor kinase CheA
MTRSQEIRAKLIAGYKAEQQDHVTQITQSLLALEKGAGDPQTLLEQAFREAHSLKGAARALGLSVIEELAHGVEDLFGDARTGARVLTPEHYDLIYRSLDACGTALAAMEGGDAAPPLLTLELIRALKSAHGTLAGAGPLAETTEPAPAAAPAPAEVATTFETIRVSVEKLDALMEHLSDLVLAGIRAEQRLVDLDQVRRLADEWQGQWAQMIAAYKYLPKASSDSEVVPWLAFLERNRDNLGVLLQHLAVLDRQLANDRLRLALVTEALDDEVKRARMLPLGTITEGFPRMMRDLARQSGKEITLRLSGTDVELDKRILERVKDPLVHLLRNAVDHGVETPQERARRGKPSDGQVTLAASVEGDRITIRVSDDGTGLDLDAIRERAVEKGLFSAGEIAEVSEAALAELIFTPGFTTSRFITDLSGRGVGLDVVRHNLEELQGTVTVESRPGRGVTFALHAPLTLTSEHGLLVRAGGQTFALPLAAVERLLRFERTRVASVEGQDALLIDGRPVGLARLDDLLGLPPTPRKLDMSGAAEQELAVLLEVRERRLAVLVDELSGEQEIVTKKLSGLLSHVAGIAGVTVLGTGRAVLVLHAADLLRLAQRGVSRTPVTTALEQQAAYRQKTILVVDDSITTRTLEKNVLTGAGYRVRLASDGEEALASLATEGTPDLLISDVMMPRLDGFSLTERLRADQRYRELPVILVTSLDSPSDKARGIAVGADAYIVKSDFDQNNLLATIEQLI